jgi:MFS family permease
LTIRKNASRFFPLLLVIYEISIYLSNDAYLSVLPHMAPALNTSFNWLPFTLTVWFLGAAGAQLFMGPVADRFGRRKTLLVGGAIYVLSSVLCGVSTQLLPFLIGRFMQGAMLGSMVVAGYATIHDSFEQKQAIQTLAWMGAVTIIAPGLGPLIGSGILVFGSWRLIFFSLAVLATLTLIGHFYCMPETTRKPTKKMSALASYREILTNWCYMGQAFAASCAIFAVVAWLTAGPWIVHKQFQQPGYYFGMYQAIIFAGFILGSQLVKPLMNRFALRKLVIFCLTLTVLVSAISFLTSYFFPMQAADFIAEMFAIAVCLGISFPVLNRLTIEASDVSMGARVAMFSAIVSVSAVLASTVVGLTLPITTVGLSLIMLAGVVLATLLYCSTKPWKHRVGSVSSTE